MTFHCFASPLPVFILLLAVVMQQQEPRLQHPHLCDAMMTSASVSVPSAATLSEPPPLPSLGNSRPAASARPRSSLLAPPTAGGGSPSSSAASFRRASSSVYLAVSGSSCDSLSHHGLGKTTTATRLITTMQQRQQALRRRFQAHFPVPPVSASTSGLS
jgi:hypothetical protein